MLISNEITRKNRFFGSPEKLGSWRLLPFVKKLQSCRVRWDDCLDDIYILAQDLQLFAEIVANEAEHANCCYFSLFVCFSKRAPSCQTY